MTGQVYREDSGASKCDGTARHGQLLQECLGPPAPACSPPAVHGGKSRPRYCTSHPTAFQSCPPSKTSMNTSPDASPTDRRYSTGLSTTNFKSSRPETRPLAKM
ncbi:hypothetical protein MTO96_008863 [Rhipicephalus appendiculatus]